jgi:uncharacterized membrane protein YtjA (UPF0391 family)
LPHFVSPVAVNFLSLNSLPGRELPSRGSVFTAQTGTPADNFRRKDATMFGWAIFFLLVALVAGALGFGGLASTSAGFATTIFYIAVILFVVSLIYSLLTGRRPPIS